MEIFYWSLWELSYTMSISPTRFPSNWAIFVYAVNTGCIHGVYTFWLVTIFLIVTCHLSYRDMPFLFERYDFSLSPTRCLFLTYPQKFSTFFLEIQRGLSNIICIFAASFAHDGLSASRAEWFLRVKQITTIAVIRRM